ncbi:hypothetical protein B446_18915 [Streptomyces collinus Tu 365]|uniref:Uncharacterized protein n=1 Tax=Streptomyces collinus (strain DSM 40733 / Tue 365) TaxID=1214242 RepID=S5VJ61_STRC3|nr:hypothetical protein B446_18915 [Streptomyces collinus Tu 365]
MRRGSPGPQHHQADHDRRGERDQDGRDDLAQVLRDRGGRPMAVTVAVAVAVAVALTVPLAVALGRMSVTGARGMTVRRAVPGGRDRPWGGLGGSLVVDGAPVVGTGPRRPTLRYMAVMAVSVAVPGATLARWLGRRIGVLVHGGHRPIIARTREALCSPRPS